MPKVGCDLCGGPLFMRKCGVDHREVRKVESSHRVVGEAYRLKWQHEHERGKSSVSVAYRVGPGGSVQIWRAGRRWPSK